MEMRLIWKYLLLVVCIADLSTAKRKRPKIPNILRQVPDLNDGLELKGTLQRQFFVETALADTTKNAVSSPFSALLLLGSLAVGATGDGLKELEASIGSPKAEIEDYFQSVFNDLSNIKGASLCVSNKIYTAKEMELAPQYLTAIQRTFKTSTEAVDFAEQRETVDLINSWVSKNTNGKIPKMLEVTDVAPGQVLLLVNTLHFVGRWEKEFRDTTGDFKTPSGIKNVKMMQRTGSFKYANSSRLDAQIVSVPYAGGSVQFCVVLPRAPRVNVARVMEAVRADPDILHEDLRKMESVDLDLTMPAFEVEAKFDLAEIYKELGVKQVFQPGTAALGGMVGGVVQPADVYVNSAIHKAYINVTATGTEAGAASAVIMVQSRPTAPEQLVIDRPFLFFIVAARQQLFSGFVVDPS